MIYEDMSGMDTVFKYELFLNNNLHNIWRQEECVKYPSNGRLELKIEKFCHCEPRIKKTKMRV